MTSTYRRLGLIVAAIVTLIDQAIKYMVAVPLALRTRVDGIELLPIFNLRWIENRGVSMGFFHADTELARWALVAMTAGIAVLVAVWLWRERSRDDAIALGLILGGAFGNIIDRVRLGYVIDYADFHIGDIRPFLVFNLADAAITIGVLILLARALMLREKAPKSETP